MGGLRKVRAEVEDATHHSLVHLGAALPLQAGLEPLGHAVSCSLGWLNPLLDLRAERWEWGGSFTNRGLGFPRPSLPQHPALV